MCFEDQKREMMSIGSSSTNASPNSMNSQRENGVLKTKGSQDFSPVRTECSKSSTMPALSQVSNNRVYYNGAHHYDEPPIRYVDESTSASSTMSSRNGAQRFISPPSTLTRYFYEKDDDEYDEEPTVISNRAYRASYDYDPPPPVMAYSSSPPYRHYSTSPVVNGNRVQSPMFYNAPHSLPRVSLTSYRNHEYGQRSDRQQTSNYPDNLAAPNVSYVKTCSVGNGIKNK